jgi:Tol biopolymer transport system component
MALPSTLVGSIAFSSNRRGGSAIYVMDPDGGRVALLSGQWAYEFASSRQVVMPDGRGYLSPDGQLVVYQDGDSGHRQVWIMNVDGSEPRNISNNRYDEYNPVWLR